MTDAELNNGYRMALRLWREEKGMTQKDVAAIFGVTPQQVQKYEAGRDRLPLVSAHRFCEDINISLSAFAKDAHQLAVDMKV